MQAVQRNVLNNLQVRPPGKYCLLVGESGTFKEKQAQTWQFCWSVFPLKNQDGEGKW